MIKFAEKNRSSLARRLVTRAARRLLCCVHGSADAHDRTQSFIHGGIRRERLSHFRVQEHEVGPCAILVGVLTPYASLHRGEVILWKYIICDLAFSLLHRTFVLDLLPVWR